MLHAFNPFDSNYLKNFYSPEFYIDSFQNTKKLVTDKVITDKTLNKAAHSYIDAQTAFEWGLVAKVFPSHTLMQETFEIAKIICDRAPVAVRLAKEAVNKSFETSLKDGMDFERRNFYLTFSSQDQKEGMKAFLEKRNPEYKGN